MKPTFPDGAKEMEPAFFPELTSSSVNFEPPSSQSSSSSRWDVASSRSTSSGPRRFVQWAPSERELRKYASLFLRTDADGDGFVGANDARLLCSRSGLSDETLTMAWNLADQDCDNRLSFREFCALVHLVSCCRKGLHLPALDQGLPLELSAALDNMHLAPEELDAQRSRSPSRSRSSSQARGMQSDGMENPSDGRLSLPLSRRSTQHVVPTLDEDADPNMNGAASRRRMSFPQPLLQSPNFGDEHNYSEPRETSAPTTDCEAIGRHLGAVREADRKTLNYVQLEADKLENKLLSSRQLGAQLQPQVERMCDETRRLTNMLQQLEMQLSASKERLLCLQQGKRGAGCTSRMMHYEKKHVTETLKFMQQTFEEEEGILHETNHANRRLEKSCESLEHDLNFLQREQVKISEEARRESESRKKEERQLSDLKEECRKLRQGAAVVAIQQKGDEGGRQHEPQPAHNSVEFTASPQWSSRHSEPYSWASSLVGGAIGTSPIVTATAADDGRDTFTSVNAP